MLDPPGVKRHIGLLVTMSWSKVESVLCLVVSILVVCPTGIHRILTWQWLLWRNCLGSHSDHFDRLSRQWSIEEGWDEKQGDEERGRERMRVRGCKAGRGEVKAKAPWIHLTRLVIQKASNVYQSVSFSIELRCSPKIWNVLILWIFKESMSEGSVQGDSNNDKLMVSTKYLFDLFTLSLITRQRAKRFLYLFGYLSNKYPPEAKTLSISILIYW